MGNIAQYAGRSSYECFAFLMGKAQILEFGLKNLLNREFSVAQEEMGKWTLGRIARELEARGARKDYVDYLKDFVKERNYIAHEMLADNLIFKSVAGDISERFEFKQLQKPAFDLERLLIVYDWLEENKAWRHR